jgi:TRAP-type C4-dicarboxylate transport system permease small subunit
MESCRLAVILGEARGKMRMMLGWLDRLNRAVFFFVGALLAAIACVVLIQVVVRFVLTAVGINLVAPWTEELARYLLVWMVFLGAAVGCRKMQLIALTFVIGWVPPLLGRAARLVALGLCLWFFTILVYYGWQFVQIIGRTELSPVMQISKNWIFWAMPVGATLMFVNTLAFVAEAMLPGGDLRTTGSLGATE